jgi:hypothetical protein
MQRQMLKSKIDGATITETVTSATSAASPWTAS